jgi:hypothetical protein
MTAACVVQFPHPGPEDRLPKDRDIVPWNEGPCR